MKKIKIFKAASDFAYANLEVTDAVQVQENALAAFKAGGFDSADLDYFLQVARQQRQQFTMLAIQNAPSAAPKPQPKAPVQAPAQADSVQ